MIPNWLQKLATGRVVVGSLVVWLTYATLFFAWGSYAALKHAGGGPLLEETFGYSATDVQKWLELVGEAGRKSYHTFQLLDGLNASLMTIALTLSLAFALGRLVSARSPLQLLSYLPVLAGVADLLENSLLVAALSSFPSETTAAGSLVGSVTSAKLVAGFVALPVTVLCFVALGIKSLRNGSRRRQEKNAAPSDKR